MLFDGELANRVLKFDFDENICYPKKQSESKCNNCSECVANNARTRVSFIEDWSLNRGFYCSFDLEYTVSKDNQQQFQSLTANFLINDITQQQTEYRDKCSKIFQNNRPYKIEITADRQKAKEFLNHIASDIQLFTSLYLMVAMLNIYYYNKEW